MTDINKPEEDEVTPFGTIEAFGQVVVTWHEAGMAILEHMLTAPEGLEVQVGEDPANLKAIVLEGEKMEAFKAGVAISLAELGTLPFVYETEPVATPAKDEDESIKPT